MTPEEIEKLEKDTKLLLKKNKTRNKELRQRVQSMLGRTGALPDLKRTPPGQSKNNTR